MKLKEKSLSPYFTWGCADDLTHRLKKTLYCSEENDCYDSSSVALTDVAVSMVLDVATNPKRKLTHRYASSLSRQLPISPCALMMGILYSEKLQQLNPSYLDRVSSSDIYVISMMVASKFLVDEGEDDEVFNDEWAEAAGLATSTVNRLEGEFLDAMDWNIYVNPNEFIEFCAKIEIKIAFKYGLQRGWFSYTDLTQFLVATQYQKILRGIMQNTVKVIGGCALLYGMSLSILATSLLYCNSSNSPNSSRDVVKTTSPCSSSDASLETTSTYARRCFTRLRHQDGDLHNNNTLYLDDDSSEIIQDLIQPIDPNQRNETGLPSDIRHCSCLRDKDDCFDAGFNIFRPTSVSLIPDNPSKRRLLCNWQLKDPYRECICDKSKLDGIHKSTSLKPTSREYVIKLPRRRFYLQHATPSPTVFGMVVM